MDLNDDFDCKSYKHNLFAIHASFIASEKTHEFKVDVTTNNFITACMFPWEALRNWSKLCHSNKS